MDARYALPLHADDWSVEILPERGGGLGHCRFDGFDILRPASPGHDPFPPLQLACFPLVPWSNRIAGSAFQFAGKDRRIAPEWPSEPNAIHGTGWLAAWTLVDSAPGRCVLEMVDAGANWPWPFKAMLVYEVGGATLTMRLRLENLSDETFPAGMGFHPYFPRSERTRLEFAADRVWQSHHNQLPVQLIDVPEEFDFSAGKPINGVSLDHCYRGWSRFGRIVWPEWHRSLVIRAGAELSHLVVYTPPGRDFFCFEPVSHMNNALNWQGRTPETGLRMLEPGDAWDVSMSMTVGGDGDSGGQNHGV